MLIMLCPDPAHYLAFGCVLGVTVIVELPRTYRQSQRSLRRHLLATTQPFTNGCDAGNRCSPN